MSLAAPTIFLTGTTGLVGGLLLQRLVAENPEQPIYSLVRRIPEQLAAANTHFVVGDIAQPQLGLSGEVYSRLCRTVETIVHCAAATRLDSPLDLARQVNVVGTRNIAALAQRCESLKMLLHVSSTYIAGRKPGALLEEPMTSPAGWFSAYEQSKFEAEQIIYEQGNVLPWVIVRLSTVVGNSRTGQVSGTNYFHQLLRLVPHNPFPFIPGDPNALVDIVADDWVTAGLFSIVKSVVPPGSVFHLCAGPSAGLTAQEVVDAVFRFHRLRQPAFCATIPSFVSAKEFQTFEAEFRGDNNARSSRMAKLLLLCLPHLEVQQTFLNGRTNSLLQRFGLTPPHTRDFLPRIIQSCV